MKIRKHPLDCVLYSQVEAVAEQLGVSMSRAFQTELLEFAYQCELEKQRRIQIRTQCVGHAPIYLDALTQVASGRIAIQPHDGNPPCICYWERYEERVSRHEQMRRNALPLS